MISATSSSRFTNEDPSIRSASPIPRDPVSRVDRTPPSDHEETALGYFFQANFADASAAERLLAPMPPATTRRKRRSPSGLSSYLSHLWNTPLLSAEQEYHGFRKLNYLKHLRSQTQAATRPATARSIVSMTSMRWRRTSAASAIS